MNFLFLTQSKTLAVFFETSDYMVKSGLIDKVGFYISDSVFFHSYQKECPDLVSGKFPILKEWDILKKAQRIKPDLNQLRKYEKKYGDPVLWNPIVADRRIYLGKRVSFEQDYRSRLDHTRMLATLQTGVTEMEAMFDRLKPDTVVSFICVTIGEYLAFLIARSRNIPFINLRPTRIKNYFHAGESVMEPSEWLKRTYDQMCEQGVPEAYGEEARHYLKQVRMTHAMYEGVIPAEKKSRKSSARGTPIRKSIWRKTKTSFDIMGRFFRYAFGEYRFDSSYPGTIFPLFSSRIKRPLRKKIINLRLQNVYKICMANLSSTPYVFFPLHKEPEVTLLVYSRSYLNQIEVARNLSISLPVGMKLVIKEHPGAVGYRPGSYYRKLLEIPNVMIAPPDVTSRRILQDAALVAVISGSIGLEAIMMKKPVVAFGRVPFRFFPKHMARYINNSENLGDEIADLLNTHKHDESAVISYLAAIFSTSAPIDFYSKLLERKGVYAEDSSGNDNYIHTKRLAEYIMESSHYYMEGIKKNIPLTNIKIKGHYNV